MTLLVTLKEINERPTSENTGNIQINIIITIDIRL